MALKDNVSIDSRVRSSVEAALETVARQKYPHGFHIDEADNEKFLRIVGWEKCTPCDVCIQPSHVVHCKNDTNEKIKNPDAVEVKKDETHHKTQENMSVGPDTQLICEHGKYTSSNVIRVSVQANYPIRVYSRAPVKVGAGAGSGVGGVAGGVGGGVGGAAVGAVAGTAVFPVVGTVVGGIIGGVVGAISGAVAGGGAGAGVGAGTGAIVSNAKRVVITAKEVFEKLPQFKHDKENNLVYCTLHNNG